MITSYCFCFWNILRVHRTELRACVVHIGFQSHLGLFWALSSTCSAIYSNRFDLNRAVWVRRYLHTMAMFPIALRNEFKKGRALSMKLNPISCIFHSSSFSLSSFPFFSYQSFPFFKYRSVLLFNFFSLSCNFAVLSLFVHQSFKFFFQCLWSIINLLLYFLFVCVCIFFLFVCFCFNLCRQTVYALCFLTY